MPTIDIKNIDCDDVVASSLRQQFTALTEKIRSRAYELFQKRDPQEGSQLDDWITAEKELLIPSQSDVKTNSDSQIITFSTKGFDAKDLEIYTIGESLIARGTKVSSQASNGSSIEESRSFLYQWPIPPDAVVSDIKAELKKDLLTITLPLRAVHPFHEASEAEPAAKRTAA